jgi:two-component system KDP operon response regulator KdpE
MDPKLVESVDRAVLLVEDEPSLARVLRLALLGAGYTPRIAVTGEEALRILEEETPAAVIVDLNLPDGRAGDVVNLLSQLAIGSRVAWVAISALTREEADSRYGPLGSRFIAKPFDPWELMTTLERLMAIRGFETPWPTGSAMTPGWQTELR